MTKSTERLSFKEYLFLDKQKIKIFEPDFPVFWRVAK
jgi:hypothetical protein